MRTTNDKKDYSLRIRINEQMYKHISKYGTDGMSNYIRDLIQRDIANKSQNSKNGLWTRD